MTDYMQRFMSGLDLVQPDWFIVFATQTDLIDYARALKDCREGYEATAVQREAERLRDYVAQRLHVAVTAALNAGLIQAVRSGEF